MWQVADAMDVIIPVEMFGASKTYIWKAQDVPIVYETGFIAVKNITKCCSANKVY